VAVVPLLNPAAQLREILVGVHDAPFDRLGRPGIVLTFVERYPPTPELVTLLELRPGHSTAHAFGLTRGRLAGQARGVVFQQQLNV